MPPVRIRPVGPESRHLRGHVLCRARFLFGGASRVCPTAGGGIGHKHHPKVRPHGKGPLKQPQHHIRRRARRHVKVRRHEPEQQIADAPPSQERFVPRRTQLSQRPQSRIELTVC